MIYDKVDLLLQRIDSQIVRHGYCEMRSTFLAFTSDTVHEYSLGLEFDLLDDETKADEWHRSIRALATTIPYARQFNWIIPLSQKIPLALMKIVAPGLARVAGMHHVSTLTLLVRSHMPNLTYLPPRRTWRRKL
jgi:hypothetical protein